MELNIAICDDENNCINLIENYLNNFKKKYKNIKWEVFYSAEELLDYYTGHGNAFNIMITDIEMNKINGVELANIIRQRDSGIIIFFLTSYTEYALQCFEPEPMNFWVKPLDEKIMERDLFRACERIKKSVDYITITQNRSSVTLNTKDIIYLEKVGRCTEIHTKDETYTVNKSLSKFINKLNNDMFVRIYQSYIINLMFVKKADKTTVRLYGSDEALTIGRAYADDFRDAFIAFNERQVLGL